MTGQEETASDTKLTPDESAPRIWKEGYNVRWYEVDAKGRLSMISICNFLQDAATRHADSRGIALNQQPETNMTWVLSRLLIKMDYYPGFQDQIHVYTWPSGTDKMFALRDFRITDHDDQTIGVCTSAWLVIDARTRRIIRVDRAFTERISNVTTVRALDRKLGKLTKLDSGVHEKRFNVRHSDLDTNQHANNVSYIGWALESVPERVYRENTLSEFEIDFQAEAVWGEDVLSVCAPLDRERNEFLHKVVSAGDGREFVRARSVWRPGEP